MIADLRDPTFLGALLYFDSAARQRSFSAAGRELGVTPSAVSHRIARLEATLGKALFERENRQVTLTREGTELAQATVEAFRGLRGITHALASRPVLRVSLGTYMSTAWLMPRLAKFEQLVPGTRIDLLHRLGSADLRNVDVAIVWASQPGAPHWDSLFDIDCVPVAAPGLLKGAEFWQSGLPPIHYGDRTAWREWLAAAGLPLDYADQGEVLRDPLLVLETAAHGRGIAIGYLPFVQDQIDAGRVEQVHPFSMASESRYWMVLADIENVLAQQFRTWVMGETQTGKAAS